MKNINPTRIEAVTLYQEIISERRDGGLVRRLNSLMPSVAKRLEIYEQSTLSLETIEQRPWTEQEKDDLQTFFNKCNLTDKVRAQIKSSSPNKCQYCGLGEVDPIDHYLPKSIFPEYAFLTINLLPCCHICNKFKGECWLDEHSGRFIINYYFDPVDEERFLFCNINYVDMIPVPTFTLNFSRTNKVFAEIVSNHFKQLHLMDRYEKESKDVITNVISDIQRNIRLGFTRDELNRADTSRMLFEHAKSLREQYGQNYWKAAVIESLGENEAFISSLIVVRPVNSGNTTATISV